MINKAIGTIVIVFLQMNIVLAQNSFEIQGIYSLTAEKLTHNEQPQIYNNQLFHSYGINGKIVYKANVFVQGGFHLRNFGTNSTIQAPIAIVDDIPTEISGQSIDIPINIGYYFINNGKLRLGISLGVNNGFLLNQNYDYYGVIIETIPIYNDYLLSLNSTVEIGLKLTDNIILDIKPIFQRQINSNNFVDYKQRGIGCQFGVSYGFGN